MLLLSLALLLAGCGFTIKHNSSEKVDINETYPQEAEVQADDFVYRIYTEKEVYKEYEETAIFAELTYVGDKDSIEISHAASPFYFPIEEQTREITVDYAMNDPEINTTLEKNVPFREKYEFAGGYSDQDNDTTIEFIQTIIDKGFPEGNYVINGSAQFTVKGSKAEDIPQSYDLNLNVGFKVVK